MFRFIKQLKQNNSFTLIELLIVIAILALLMSIIIITLNPAEMLKKTRDTKRISNLKSINNSLGIFQATRPSASIGTANIVYISIPDSSSTCANLGLPALTTGYQYQCSTTANYRKTDGTGWIPVNFDSLDIGSPLSSLPIDPTNTTSTGLYYTYVVGGSWELRTLMESADQEQAINDGDAYPGLYSLGSTLNLTPGSRDRGLVGYWTFDETGTSISDYSGFGNTGLTYSSSSLADLHTTGCKVNSCVVFDGTDDFMSVANNSSLNPTNAITIAHWINPGSVTGPSETFRKSAQYSCFLNEGSYSFFPNIAGNDRSGPATSLVAGQWQHIVWTYDSSSRVAAVYKNGQLITTTSFSGLSSYTLNGSGGTILVLGRAYAVWRHLNGSLDDFRIYSHALSANEIKVIYEGTR